MANTRFKTENGLLVTGGNAHFQNEVNMYANLVVDADLVLVRGDLQVQGTQVFTGGQQYDSDIVATTDGLNLGNTTNQFNAFLGTVRVFDGLFPQGNTLPLGNSTNRWVITANTLNLSGNAVITGAVTLSNTLSATGAVTFSNTLSVTGAVTFANTLSVTGVVSTSANANFDSGVLFVDAVNNRVGINNTAPAVALRVTGAADMSSTANIQGNANVGGTLGVAGLLTATGGLTAGAVNTSFDTSVLFVDALNNRVGINNTAPGVDLRVTGAVDISGTANIQNNANVSGTLGVSGTTTLGGNVVISGTSHTVAGNIYFAISTLMVDSALTRVGIGTSTPDTKLQVVGNANVGGNIRISGSANVGTTLGITGAANALSTLGITGAANALSTLGITGAANALSTLGVNGLITGAAGLTVTGTINASANLNVGTYATGVVNGVNVTNNALLIGNNTANAILTGSSLSINATSATLNVGTSFTVNSSLVNAIALNVVNQTNTARLFVTTSANVGTAFVANTTELTHTGRITFSNTSPDAVVIGNPGSRSKDSTSSDSLVTIGRTYTGTETSLGIWLQNEIANSALTSSVYHIGTYIHSANKSQNKNSGGSPVDTTLTSLYATAQNAPGNSSVWGSLTGVRGRVEQSANGSAANSTFQAVGGRFDFEVQGSGVTTFGYGVLGQVLAGNNSVTGNIGTAVGVHSTILSNTAMTIETGYLYYGIHYGNKTTNKYGLYLVNEGNNYLSSNLSVLGGAITVGNSSITTVITGNTNARGARTIRAYTGSASGGSSGDIIYEY